MVDPSRNFENRYLFYRFTSEAGGGRAGGLDAVASVGVAGHAGVGAAARDPVQQIMQRLEQLEGRLEFLQVALMGLVGGLVVVSLGAPAIGYLLCLAALVYASMSYGVPTQLMHDLGLGRIVARLKGGAAGKAESSDDQEEDEEQEDDEELGRHLSGSPRERMRRVLETHYPESRTMYSDAYLESVMSAPDRKNPNKRRTFSYARDKLLRALELREQYMTPPITEEMLGPTLSCGSLYWYGCDTEQRPILWVRPQKKDWKNIDVELEGRLHVFMIEYGIRHMPKGVTCFTVVADAANMGMSQANPTLMKTLLKLGRGGGKGRGQCYGRASWCVVVGS